MNKVVAAIEAQPFYHVLFNYSFGDDQITEERVKKSIGAFVNTIGSYHSTFDQAATKNSNNVLGNFADFSPAENRGKELFLNNCTSCHSPSLARPLLQAADNGLDENPSDKGLGGFTLDPQDIGLFKVPNLRNIALTAPYMHDGRFNTLDEVVEHYSSGIKNSPNLSYNLIKNGQPKQLHLSSDDKKALVSFLKTLTDESFLTEPKWSDPFLK